MSSSSSSYTTVIKKKTRIDGMTEIGDDKRLKTPLKHFLNLKKRVLWVRSDMRKKKSTKLPSYAIHFFIVAVFTPKNKKGK